MKADQRLKIDELEFEVLIAEETVQQRIRELGEQISRDYAGKIPIMVGVLNGGVLFLADLIRSLSIDCEMDFIKISSYGNKRVSSGEITMIKDFSADLHGRDIIVIEDIVDSGLSVQYLKRRIRNMKFVSLLVKREAMTVDLTIDYVGFEIKNKFVIGYGLDYKQLKRNVNAIYQLAE